MLKSGRIVEATPPLVALPSMGCRGPNVLLSSFSFPQHVLVAGGTDRVGMKKTQPGNLPERREVCSRINCRHRVTLETKKKPIRI